MKLAIETYVTTIIIVLSIMVCSSFIKAELQINAAKDFHSSCIALIEASDFDREVIETCQTNATKRGYSLKVENTLSGEAGADKVICAKCKTIYSPGAEESTQCTNCGDTQITKYVVNRLYLVELNYKIELIGDTQIGVINGYAR